MDIPCMCCGRNVPARIRPNGMLAGSNALRSIDPCYFFCTLRCAAVYGAKTVLARAGIPVGARALLAKEDKQRDENYKNRLLNKP